MDDRGKSPYAALPTKTPGATANERSESAVRWWKDNRRTEVRRPVTTGCPGM